MREEEEEETFWRVKCVQKTLLCAVKEKKGNRGIEEDKMHSKEKACLRYSLMHFETEKRKQRRDVRKRQAFVRDSIMHSERQKREEYEEAFEREQYAQETLLCSEKKRRRSTEEEKVIQKRKRV